MPRDFDELDGMGDVCGAQRADECRPGRGPINRTEIASIGVPCVVFRVSRLWREGMDEDDLYDITRGWWVMGPKREQAQYALAVAKGFVRGVYLVHDWRPRHYDDDGVNPSEKTRWGFDGEPAGDQAHLIGADVRHLFPRGSANPVRYLNLDDAGPATESAWEAARSVADPRLNMLRLACRELQNNPVLHLSLGSKELFHSNLLGWLFERSPDLARDTLSPWLVYSPHHGIDRVRRESHHLDLIVELAGAHPIVLENKVFSLPDEEQLDRYADDNIPAAGLVEPVKLLLSLADPGWAGNSYRGWTWVPYPDLARQVVKAVARHLPEDEFTITLVQQWAGLVLVLKQMSDQIAPVEQAEPFLLDGDTVELLRAIHLHDAFQKFRGFGVRRLLQRRFTEVALACDDLECGFTNGTPLLSARVRLRDGSQIGWQLQGAQWRRFLIVPEALRGKGEAKKAARIAYADEVHSTWFSLSDEQRVGPFASAPSTVYKHFAPDFVYDYLTVPAISIGQVLELGEVSLRAARDYRTNFGSVGASSPAALDSVPS